MKETARMNAMRSGVVVIGALAFGYLTLQLGFKPFLERAEAQQQALLHRSEPSSSQELSDTELFFSDDSPLLWARQFKVFQQQNSVILIAIQMSSCWTVQVLPSVSEIGFSFLIQVCLVGERELAPYILSIINTSGEHKKWAMLKGRKRRKGNI
nr:hypothetical protein DM860_002429 [Ipomoea batatas]